MTEVVCSLDITLSKAGIIPNVGKAEKSSCDSYKYFKSLSIVVVAPTKIDQKIVSVGM